MEFNGSDLRAGLDLPSTTWHGNTLQPEKLQDLLENGVFGINLQRNYIQLL